MASTDQDLRRELGGEREELAEAVETLRSEFRAKLPVAAAGALGLVFVVSGGIGATVRLLMRRGRRDRD
jgi:hypothetical protein